MVQISDFLSYQNNNILILTTNWFMELGTTLSRFLKPFSILFVFQGHKIKF